MGTTDQRDTETITTTAPASISTAAATIGSAEGDRNRVVVVERHVLFAQSLQLALDMDGYQALAVSPINFTTPQALLSKVLRLQPALVLLDLDLGGLGDGTRLVAPLHQAGVKVVVVTADPNRARWGACLMRGARQVLPKSGTLDDGLTTVRRVMRGLPVLPESERRELIALARQSVDEHAEIRKQLERLTPRERAVLDRLILGETVCEVAARFVVSEATVRSQVKAILSKLSVSSQLAAVGLANRVGWRAPAECA